MVNLENMNKLIVECIDLFWDGFSPCPFALYDSKNVYLYNHPKYNYKQKAYHSFRLNEQFSGASTVIMYEDYPTAIVNMDDYKDMETAFSVVAHEMFHVYQHNKGEKRFPNEILGITYPLMKENIELRMREREELHKAIKSNSKEGMLHHLKEFVLYRESRKKLINEYLGYETSIESVEGPAFYIEASAYSHIVSEDFPIVLEKYLPPLLDHQDATSNIRKGCYMSGLFLCVLLDKIQPNWKDSFFEHQKTLYELLKEEIPPNDNMLEHIKISEETKQIIDIVNKERQLLLSTFENNAGYHLFLIGDIISKGFDPMNIVSFDDRLLHRTFLSIQLNEQDYVLKQPVIAYYKKKYSNINKIHLVLEEKPIFKNDGLKIEGLGEFRGKYKIEDGAYYLYC